MRKPVVKLDDEVGKLIGFTSDLFEHGIIWNSLPVGIYVNALYPIEGREATAIRGILDRFNELNIRARFIAPTKTVIKYLKEYGYFYYTDPAGTPNWVRLSSKGLTALCGRLGLTEEEITRQSQDYAV